MREVCKKELCKTHKSNKRYCDQCLLDINAEQAVVMDHLYRRLDATSEVVSELLAESNGTLQEQFAENFFDRFSKHIMDIENDYPVACISVMETIPWRPDMKIYLEKGQMGPFRGELREIMSEAIARYSLAVEKTSDALLGLNGNGFFIYRFIRDGSRNGANARKF